MPNFTFSASALQSPTIEPETAFYSAMTQRIANNFPLWMQVRQDPTSSGQQFLNAAGVLLQEADRAFYAAVSGLSLPTADINQADIIYKVQFPRINPISASQIPTCTGDNNNIIQVFDVNDFLYFALPTRISNIASTSTAPPLNFGDQLYYDIPYTDPQTKQYPMYFQFDPGSSKLQKYFLVDTLQDVQPAVVPTKNIINTYTLNDINGNPISGTYKGASIYWDRMVILFGQTLYVFDVRSPLLSNMASNWSGNAEQTSLNALAEVALTETLTNAFGVAFDINKKYVWINNAGTYLQYGMNFDYLIFDDTNQTFFFREQYTDLIIGGITYSAQFFSVWNWFDEFGLMLDTPRLTGEFNQDYQERLEQVFQFRANSAAQGYINGTTRELGLDYWGYYPSGDYPTNIFSDGNLPSGIPIYLSGVYPSGVQNIAEINALYDPPFYSGVVSSGNIPTATFVDYTQEIMQTFPILWGSGTGDPYGFIWDLSPFDGGLNNATQVPDFFALMPSGIPSIWFQSGVQDPTIEDVDIRFFRDPNDRWIPQAHTGAFFINQKQYYNFASPSGEIIPSGTMDYFIIGSGFIIPGAPIVVYDVSGTLASGVEFVQVNEFDNNPNEYIYSGGQIIFNAPHDELDLFYETSASGWYTIPGWDFNPTHAAVSPGFIWISDQEQIVTASGCYTLTVTPDILSFGTGGSVVIGQLLDTTGNAVIGATTHFDIIPSGFGSLTSVLGITGLDGRSFSFYNPPTSGALLSTATMIASGELVVPAVINTLSTNEIWTLYTEPDPIVSGILTSGLVTIPPPISNPFYDTFMYMVPNQTYRLTVEPSGWNTQPSGFYNGAFQGQYVIGGTSINNFYNNVPVGDDFFNIQLNSLTYDTGSLRLPITNITNNPTPTASGLAFEADAYANPLVYGKIIVYTVTIPSGPVFLNFNTYAPIKPAQVVQNAPASGDTTILYNQALTSGLNYLVGYPLSVQIESWADYNGVSTDHVFQTINMDYSNAQTGVFQIAGDGQGGKFLDFLSYLRIT